jgi:predicted permease
MSAPRWARKLITRAADPHRVDEAVGDLDEAHRGRVARHGRMVAALLTSVEAIDVAWALRREARRRPINVDSVARRRGLPLSWLDCKLGLRMVVKHPGLSIVSTLGMTVAVAIGAVTFGVIRGMTASPLPLDEGDRIVTIWGGRYLRDLMTSREELTALDELGAHRIVTRNLIGDDGSVVSATVVQMTASGFRIARVPPVLGRYLVDDDERPGAPPVAVIGWSTWQDRFAGDPDVIGQSIRLGATTHEIVGVMPNHFAFPINNRLWTALQLDPEAFPSGGVPSLVVFGRLASGASMSQLEAQVQVVRDRSDASSQRVRWIVYPFTQDQAGGPFAWALYLVQVVVSMVLVAIAINVAVLVYARTLARIGEVAVRTALGASRLRIASQLFAEAFLLSGMAAAAGLMIARYALGEIDFWMRQGMGEAFPHWWRIDVSTSTLAYAFGLAVLAAAIIGVGPALSATGRRLKDRLHRVGPGGTAPGLGRIWTALIVIQFAAAVAILPIGLSGVMTWGRAARPIPSVFPLDEVLTARLELDTEILQPGRYAALREEVVRRLETDPSVTHVALVGDPPTWLDPDVPFEIDEGPTASLRDVVLKSASTGHLVGRSFVSPAVFAAFDVPVVSGRLLDARDVTPVPSTVVVNQSFVDLVLGDANPLGRRIRFPRSEDSQVGALELAWLTIVGVIPDFPPSSQSIGTAEGKAYIPFEPEGDEVVNLVIRLRDGDAAAFADVARRLTAQVDPMLRLGSPGTLSRGVPGLRTFDIFVPIVALALVVLLLAVAGLYALMSFTVARRHREIGIRTALGAEPRRVLLNILVRAAWQLALGLAMGIALADGADRLAGGELLAGRGELLLPGVAAMMVLVGVLAAWGPAKQALGVQPTEALRAE